jgi:hypothetical protein
MVNRLHPLVGFVFGAVVLGIVAAAFADDREPVWALHSEWVYRAEVGAAVFALLYVALVALLLAGRGEAFRKVQAPGGAGIETPAKEIDTAANEFEEFRSENDAHLGRLERAIDELNQRVERLEN